MQPGQAWRLAVVRASSDEVPAADLAASLTRDRDRDVTKNGAPLRAPRAHGEMVTGISGK